MIHYLRALAARLRGLFGDRRADRDLDDEIETHLRLLTERYVRQGMTEVEAARAARRQFGNATLLKEAHREMRGIRLIDTLFQDLHYGARMLVKHKGFTTAAFITLALGIGANTAIFSVVNAVLLRPLPFADAGQLLIVQEAKTDGVYGISYPNFLDLRARASAYEAIAIFNSTYCTLAGEGLEATRLPTAVVSANLFPALGATPALGRGFLPEEDQRGGGRSGRPVILSHGLWRRRFSGDPYVVGRLVTLDRLPFTVVGVMPAGFQFPLKTEPAELWTTVAVDAEPTFHGGEIPTSRTYAYYAGAIGRLKAGITPQLAQAELDQLATGLRSQYGFLPPRWRFIQTPALEWLVGNVRLPLLVLLGAVTFVLLIACANVGNLLLARAITRRKEMAVRAALGAGRWRVMRQLLTESLLLAILGGAGGLLFALWGVELLAALIPPDIPRITEIDLDWRVASFTLAATLLTGLACGLAPALAAGRIDSTDALKEGPRWRDDGLRGRFARGVLVVAQVSLTFVLLTGAGLLAQSFMRLQRVQPGFVHQQLLTFKLHLPESVYPQLSPKVTAFYRQLQERLRALPDVQAVSVAHMLPLSGGNIGTSIEIDGRPAPEGQRLSVGLRVIDRDYFRTLSIPFLKGQDFSESEGPQTSGKIIVNESFVRRFLAGVDPLGQRVKTPFGGVGPREIIGVVRDVRHRSLRDEPQPEMYVPLAQFTFNELTVIVRTAAEPLSLTSQVKQIAHGLDQSLPVYELKTMDQYLAGVVARPRFNTLLVSLFAVLALLLAGVGLYGVLAHAVTQRTHELGIRLALGAQVHDLLKLILGQGCKLALAGVALGVAASLALTHVMKNLLFNVSATDPATFALIALLLVGVALIASYVPARRATKVDPLQALRHE